MDRAVPKGIVLAGSGLLALLMTTIAPILAEEPSRTAANPPAAEELPWLAPTGGENAKKPADAPKKAKGPVKCEEQGEDDCRAAANCAWVAHIPQADGSFTPARCAEKKVPGKEQKPKSTAAKPKPKPQPESAQPAEAKTATPGATAAGEQKPAKTNEPPSSAPAAAEVSGSAPTAPAKAAPSAVAESVPSAVVKVPTEIPAPGSQTSTVSPAEVPPIKPQSP